MRDLSDRLILAAMAAGGAAAYAVVLWGPLALVLLANPWTAYFGPWPVLATIAALALAFRPRHAMHGEEVPREHAPALFEAADALADRIGAPRIQALRLSDELNAAAMEEPMRWPPGRRRRTLVLGVPLLALLDVDDARSVIAHELGHFSRRHGRLGQWLYRVRARWLAYAEATGPQASTSLWERGAARFAGWFAPAFSRRSFAWARRCEYEADAFGAAVVGAPRMAAALFTLEVLAGRWQQLNRQGLADQVATRPEPPADWLGELGRQLLHDAPGAADWQRLQARPSGAHDTHPSLGERVAALGVGPDAVLATTVPPAAPAGQAWLRDWPAAVARYNAQWQADAARGWRSGHLRVRQQRARLDALRAGGDFGLERGWLELQVGEPAFAAACAAQRPGDPLAAYLQGRSELERGLPAGFDTLARCITSNPAWAEPARRAMARHEALWPDAAARQRNQALLARARQRRAEAAQRILDDVPLARLDAAPPDACAAEILREVIAGWPAVAGAWCGRAGVDIGPRHHDARVLVLRLRPQVLSAAGLTEDDVARDAAQLLDALHPPPVMNLVWPAYTTEPLTPELDATLARWTTTGDGSCLLAPPEGECAAPGVRASAIG